MDKEFVPDFIEAFSMAARAHSGQIRKGSEIPYIAHPMDVASMLLKAEEPMKIVLAGLLHDCLEDTEVTPEEIEEAFGEEVLDLVKAASEPEDLAWQVEKEKKKKSWRERKEHTVEFVRQAPLQVQPLLMADKLSNLRDTWRNLQNQGETVWERFNAPFEDQKWYYQSLRDAFAAGPHSMGDHPLFGEFDELVKEVFGQ